MIHPVFLFDANYVGPALVSAASFIKVPGMQAYPLTLLFLSRQQEADNKARVALATFDAAIKEQHPGLDVRVIELHATVFDDYVQRYHFSSAILYKLVLPQVFPTYEHIVLFDCGMLFGRRVAAFLDGIAERIARADIAPIGAFCCDPTLPGALGENLRHHPHNTRYPAGAILYFDVARYAEARLYERFVQGFHAFKHELAYGEQDLMCLTLREDELSDFGERDDRHHIDMAGPDTWFRMPEYERLYASGDHFYIKHVGSFKPWKKWVLHPAKGLYLRQFEALRPLLGGAVIDSLRDDAAYPSDIRFLQQQLYLLETYYEKVAPLA
ncbi:MAG: hypothetical protein ACLGI6_12015 [Gammaproteobacteria bacterium]